jgi:predicted Zn-dependent protease
MHKRIRIWVVSFVAAVRLPYEVTWLLEWVAYGISRVGYRVARAGARGFARHLFKIAHQLAPRGAFTLRYLAWSLKDAGDLEGAIPHYKELLKQKPESVDGRVELGHVFGALERYPEALEQFERALDYAPRDSEARGMVATMLICINHFKEAIPICEDLVRDDPGDVVIWGFLGRCRFEVAEWDGALAAYETAQGLHSGPLVAIEHASVLMELNRYDEAETVLNAALTAHAGDRSLRARLAATFVEQRRYVDAENILRDILHEEPAHTEARCFLAGLFADTDRAEQAAAVAGGVSADFPDDPIGHATLAWVAMKAGRSQDALTAYEAALRILPGQLNLTAGRATALKRLGRDSEAQILVTAILERDYSFFDRNAWCAELTTLASDRSTA